MLGFISIVRLVVVNRTYAAQKERLHTLNTGKKTYEGYSPIQRNCTTCGVRDSSNFCMYGSYAMPFFFQTTNLLARFHVLGRTVVSARKDMPIRVDDKTTDVRLWARRPYGPLLRKVEVVIRFPFSSSKLRYQDATPSLNSPPGPSM